VNQKDLDILNLSARQFATVMSASHQTRVQSLLGPRAFALDASATPPAPSAAAATPGAPDPTSLTNILNSVIKAPGTTSIATAPTAAPDPSNPADPNNALYALLAQIQTLDSYISVLTAFCIYNEHPAPYDITDHNQATAFIQAQAKWRNYVLTGGTVKALAAYLPVGEISQSSMSKEVTSADLHLEFLGTLFGSFGFSGAATKQLDGILTSVTDTLKNLSGSFESESQTMDHLLSYYYFETVQGTGGDTGIPALYKANMRMFYMHIDQSSWKVSIGKSSVEHFKFDMNYYDMTTTMAAPLVAADMPTINSSIQTLTGQDSDTINKLMNMKAITAPPQNS
jgi:hypothetical protein